MLNKIQSFFSSKKDNEKERDSGAQSYPVSMKSHNDRDNNFQLNFTTIPFFRNYLTARDILCDKMNGQKTQDYDFKDTKLAGFTADFNGRKNVEFCVYSEEKDNTTTSVTCHYVTSANPIDLKKGYKELVVYLDKMYGKPTITVDGDIEAYFDWLNLWKDTDCDDSNYFLTIRAYILPEGTVYCWLRFSPHQYLLTFFIIPRAKEDQERLQWRISPPASFPLLFPVSAEEARLHQGEIFNCNYPLNDDNGYNPYYYDEDNDEDEEEYLYLGDDDDELYLYDNEEDL